MKKKCYSYNKKISYKLSVTQLDCVEPHCMPLIRYRSYQKQILSKACSEYTESVSRSILLSFYFCDVVCQMHTYNANLAG